MKLFFILLCMLPAFTFAGYSKVGSPLKEATATLLFTTKSSSTGYATGCSAALVKKDLVVTARHCLNGSSGADTLVGVILPTGDGSFEAIEIAKVIQPLMPRKLFSVYDFYENDRTTIKNLSESDLVSFAVAKFTDFVFIKLKTPSSNKPFDLLSDKEVQSLRPINPNLQLLGYPLDNPFPLSRAGFQSPVVHDSLCSLKKIWNLSHELGLQVPSKLSNLPLMGKTSCRARQGNSGGPVVFKTSDSYKMLGISVSASSDFVSDESDLLMITTEILSNFN